MNDSATPSEAKKVKLEPAKLKSLLPPSTFLFRGNRPLDGSAEVTRPPIETDVGILEYVGREIEPFQGIIKQRYVELELTSPFGEVELTSPLRLVLLTFSDCCRPGLPTSSCSRSISPARRST